MTANIAFLFRSLQGVLGAAGEGIQGCEKASTVLAVLQPGLSCSAACVAHMLCDGLTDEIWTYAHML